MDKDIYNFNKTGFAIELITIIKVVSRVEMPGKPWLIQLGNQEWVITIKYINSKGWLIPSTIIFKGKVYIKGWFNKVAIPGDQRVEISTNKQTIDIISLHWLQKVFILAINGCTRGGYQLLILDSYRSHLMPEFNITCKENNIIVIYMPAYLSYLL